MPQAWIKAVDYHLPEGVLTNEELAAQFPEWGVEKIAAKTGIRNRHIAAPSETSSDLALAAARRLFASGVCTPAEIDFLLLCTQTPDQALPTTACVLQHRLELPTACGALDFNLGCSGFVYGLGLARGLVETGQARNVLLITAETYSKLLDPADKSVRSVFGDGAAATLVSASPADRAGVMGPFRYGTDGSGARFLGCPRGGFRTEVGSGYLSMDGPEVFNFTLRSVPPVVNELLAEAGRRLEDVDLFVFHQANAYMLEHLRKKLGIPAERFVLALEQCGNTVSATIPIALCEAVRTGRLKRGMRVMVVGFGVGLSWGAALLDW